MIAKCNLTTCVFLSHVRNIGMKSVTYWYQFFTALNLRSVKITVQQSYVVPLSVNH